MSISGAYGKGGWLCPPSVFPVGGGVGALFCPFLPLTGGPASKPQTENLFTTTLILLSQGPHLPAAQSPRGRPREAWVSSGDRAAGQSESVRDERVCCFLSPFFSLPLTHGFSSSWPRRLESHRPLLLSSLPLLAPTTDTPRPPSTSRASPGAPRWASCVSSWNTRRAR